MSRPAHNSRTARTGWLPRAEGSERISGIAALHGGIGADRSSRDGRRAARQERRRSFRRALQPLPQQPQGSFHLGIFRLGTTAISWRSHDRPAFFAEAILGGRSIAARAKGARELRKIPLRTTGSNARLREPSRMTRIGVCACRFRPSTTCGNADAKRRSSAPRRSTGGVCGLTAEPVQRRLQRGTAAIPHTEKNSAHAEKQQGRITDSVQK